MGTDPGRGPNGRPGSINADVADDIMDGIDNDFKNMTAVSGGGRANQFGSDRGNVSTSDLGGSGGFTGDRGVDENVGPGGQRSGGDNAGPAAGDPGRGGSPRRGGSPGGGPGSGSSSTGSPGTFICTAAYHTGLTSDYIWSANKRFGVSIRKHDPYLYKGYELFGPWVAKQINKGKFKAFATFTPKVWAYEQAKNTHGNVSEFSAPVKIANTIYKYTMRPLIRVLGWIKTKL